MAGHSIVRQRQPLRSLQSLLWFVAVFVLSAAAQSPVFASQAPPAEAEDGLPLPPVPQSYKNIKERQQREAEERNDPNSPERDAYNQYAESAKSKENAAIQDLQAAIDGMKAAGAHDPKDVEGRNALVRAAQDRAANALRNFESAASDAKTAQGFANDLKKMGITPDSPTYDPRAVDAVFDGLRASVVVARHAGPGPETTPDEDLDNWAAEHQKGAIDQFRDAVKAAREAGTMNRKDVLGHNAKAKAALDLAAKALGNIETGERFARTAEQNRQSEASQRFRQNVPYGQPSQPPPMMPPYGYGMGGYGYGVPRRDEEPKPGDPWPGGWGPWLTPQ
jgi:hypothetical protein